MKVYSHFAVTTLSNTYVVGLPSGEAILVDPTVFDGDLLDLIEDHGYTVSCTLVTHANDDHLAGLRTMSKIYSDVCVVSAVEMVAGHSCSTVTAGQTLDACGSRVNVIGLPGMGRDCLAYQIGGFIFTGVALSAGELGPVSNPYAKAILLTNIRDEIFSFPDSTVILPFYGPPTTVGVERETLPMEDPLELAGLA